MVQKDNMFIKKLKDLIFTNNLNKTKTILFPHSKCRSKPSEQRSELRAGKAIIKILPLLTPTASTSYTQIKGAKALLVRQHRLKDLSSKRPI